MWRPSAALSTNAVCCAAAIVALVGAPAALADTAISSNWAGYAAHRAGVRFRSVVAEWQVPAVTCATASPAWSSSWVGLGGYRQRSTGLDQTGTESDCSRTGHPVYVAWYELVPSPARRLPLHVSPGDVMGGLVSAAGRRITITLEDLTTHRGFRRTFDAENVDATSAEWIVEAPSGCTQAGSCQPLPLADFGRVGFASAQAVTRAGRTGAIRSPWWSTTTITLIPGGPRFASAGAPAEAVPTPLSAGASAFSVTYRHTSRAAGDHARRAALPSSVLVARLLR